MSNDSMYLLEIMTSLEKESCSTPPDSTLNIFCNKTTAKLWFSVLGGAAQALKPQVSGTEMIPDNNVIIFVGDDTVSTHSRNTEWREDGAVPIKLRDGPGLAYMVDISSFIDGQDKVMKMPHSGIRIAKSAHYLREYTELGTVEAVRGEILADNLVGGFMLPVVSNSDKVVYHTNAFGSTFDIPSVDVDEVGKAEGLWILNKEKRYERLGDLSDFVFKDESTLTKEVVLYSSRVEADRYLRIGDLQGALTNQVKTEQLKLEQELIKIKSETSKVDNERKVETLNAKGNYEVNSLGRKDSQESVSHGRTLTIGLVACGTAAIGLAAKLGLSLTATPSVTLPGLALTSLIALFTCKPIRAVVSYAVSVGMKVVRGAASICSGIARSVGGVIGRGALRLIGI